MASLNLVEVQRRTVSHFKGLFKTFKMRYSTFLYSYWIRLHVHFKKNYFTPKKGYYAVTFVLVCTNLSQTVPNHYLADLFRNLVLSNTIYEMNSTKVHLRKQD